MDPNHEQRLRDEVIYLHSLWHQGPPRAAASSSTSAVRHNLQPPKTTQFKKEKKPKGKRGKKSKNKPNNAAPEPNSSPGVEWPCPTPPPPSTTGWASLEPKPDSKPISLSPEEQLRVDSRNAHQHALKTVHEFFRSNHGDDSDVADSSSDDDDEMMEEDNGREEYGFFLKVFEEDTLLKEFYDKNFAKGEFSCLVCGALGGKGTGKKFKGCLALVQHSIAIAKTKKRRAHRAFGQAVCKALGWDIDRLPSIVSSLSDKSGETEGNLNGHNKESSIITVNNVDSVEGNNGEAVPENGPIGTEVLPNGDEGDMNSLKCPDNDKNLEDVSMVHPHIVQEPAAEGLTSNSLTCPDANKNSEDSGLVNSHNLEDPSSEGLASNSLTFPDTDKSLEDIGIVHPHIMEEPTAELLTSVPLDENNTLEIEVQDVLMVNTILADGRKEDNNENKN